MDFRWKEGICSIEIESNERILITSKKAKSYSLEVTIDEYDDLTCAHKLNCPYPAEQILLGKQGGEK